MTIKRLGIFAAAGILFAGLAGAAAAQAPNDLRATGRRVANELADSIVSVRVVVSMKMSRAGQDSREDEQKNETNGTVVAPDGTTVVRLHDIDPSVLYRRMLGAEGAKDVTLDSRVKDLKIVVNKRTEIPATVVQRDPDLDLAIIRPVDKPKEPFKAVDLKNTADPELLEQVFVLARMGRVADYQIGVMTGEIQSIVTKPRKFYVPSAELASGGYGVPIFNAAAKLVGIVMMRTVPGVDDGPPDNVGIILPAGDIQDIVAQAAKAQP